jgi:hypothetical protein
MRQRPQSPCELPQVGLLCAPEGNHANTLLGLVPQPNVPSWTELSRRRKKSNYGGTEPPVPGVCKPKLGGGSRDSVDFLILDMPTSSSIRGSQPYT